MVSIKTQNKSRVNLTIETLKHCLNLFASKLSFFFEKITQQNILTALKIEQAIEQKHRRILTSLIGLNLFAKLKFLKQAGEQKSFEMF